MTDDGNISDFFEVCYLIVMHRQYRMVLGLGLVTRVRARARI